MTLQKPPYGLKKKVLYRSLVDDIKRQIDERLLLPGDKLPSIADLAGDHHVSHITVRSALAELSKMGYILSKPRSGIYVSPESVRRQHLAPRPAGWSPFSGAARGHLLESAVIGLIAVAPAYDLAAPDRWSYFNHHHISILRGAEQAIGEAGGTGKYTHLADWTQIHRDFPIAAQAHLDDGVAAVIVVDIHNHPGLSDEVMRLVGRPGPPVVYVSSGETCAPPFHVYCDNRASGLLAGKHLLRQGYRDIVFVGPLDNHWVDERSEGVARAVADEGTGLRFRELPVKRDRLADSPVHDGILEAKDALLRSSLEQLTGWPGIVAANDDAAMHLHHLLSAQGLTAGRDYGLIGFDDEPQVRSLGISSMCSPFGSLGRQAVLIALQAVKGDVSNAVVKLPPVLFSRESTLVRGR
jgi:DNA-binding LacI/PurR family transcriptional regulator